MSTTHSFTRIDTNGEIVTFHRSLPIPGAQGDVVNMGTARASVAIEAQRRTVYYTPKLGGGATGTNGTMQICEISDPLIPAASGRPLWLIGVGGQSNNVGEGSEAPAMTVPSVANAPRLWVYKCSGEWALATEPLHDTTQTQDAFYATFNGALGYGSCLRMADILLDTRPDIDIGLVPFSVGGRYAAEFIIDTTRGSYGGAMTARARHALRREGAVWWFFDLYQGEADSKADGLGAGWGAQWQANLVDFADRIDVASMNVMNTILPTDNPDAVTYTQWEAVRASQTAFTGTSGTLVRTAVQAPTYDGGDPTNGPVHQKTSKQMEHGANKAARINSLQWEPL